MTKKILIFFILAILAQAGYSFLVPTFGTSDCWKDLSALNNYKGHTYSSFDQDLVGKVYGLVGNYHVVCDAGGFVLLAHDFPADYFRGRTLFINRPLYPLLVNLAARPLHLIVNSYSMTFAAAILVNILLFFASCVLFYRLAEKYFSPKTALISVILLIFSPFAHSWLVQPEGNILGLFSVVAALALLDDYVSRPTRARLMIYSLIVGVTFLVKMNIAISIFIFFLAVYGRKFKQGAVFFLLHLVPLALWYLVAAKWWGLAFGVQEVSKFGAGVWILALYKQPLYRAVGELLAAVPNFFTALFYGFLGLPVILSLVGLYKAAENKFYILYGGLLGSFFVLMFALHFYLPRHAFLVFPLVYPLAVAGIETVAAAIGNESARKFFIAATYFLIIAPTFLDIFKLYEYLGVIYS